MYIEKILQNLQANYNKIYFSNQLLDVVVKNTQKTHIHTQFGFN